MKRTLCYTIHSTGPADECISVASFLRQKGFSARMLTMLRASRSSIELNGEHPYLTKLLHPGDILRVTVPEDPVLEEKCLFGNPASGYPFPIRQDAAASREPEDLLSGSGIRILLEDEDLLAVSKPAGMPTHPSKGYSGITLQELILAHYQAKGEPFPVRCIDRLDRDTSGIVLIGKHLLSASVLSSEMKKREIRKTYLAIVRGHASFPGIISGPIARAEMDSVMRTVDFLRGESAITRYTPASYDPSGNLTLMILHPLTGRTHQLRVHMKYAGLPIIGDFLYEDEKASNEIKRQALHAWRMELIHPITGQPVDIKDPLPDDMKSYFPNPVLFPPS